MENFIKSRRKVGLLIALMLGAWTAAGFGQETNTPAEPAGSAAMGTNAVSGAELQLRSYLKLQEQLHSTLLAIEQARSESSEETRTNAEILATRLDLLERSLMQQREFQLQSLHSSNSTLLIVAASAVGLGLLVLLFTAISQSRGMNRLAEIAAGISHDRALLANGFPRALEHGDRAMFNMVTNGESHSALFSTIDRLEQRIRELELTTDGAAALELPGRNGAPLPSNDSSQAGDRLSALLSKGQVLLNLGQANKALAAFDEAIGVSPETATAHLRRGMALERLKRRADAIAAYERAMTLDPTMTQAYLGKGSVLNEMERHTEALECYEQALRCEKKA